MRTRTSLLIFSRLIGCVIAFAAAERAFGAGRTPNRPVLGQEAEAGEGDGRATRQQMAAAGAQLDRALACPTCHGRRSVMKPRKRDARGVIQVENPPDIICPDCKGEGLNSNHRLIPLLRDYCLKLDDIRQQEPESLLARNPPLVSHLLRRVRWAETSLRLNRQWETMRTELDEPVIGQAYVLTVEALRSCRPASGDFELVQARVLFARDAIDADTVFLLLPTRCPTEVEAKFRQNKFARMMVLAYDIGPAERERVRLELDEDAESASEANSGISVDAGLIANFHEAAIDKQAPRLVLGVAGSRVIRANSLKSVSAPARTIYRPPPIPQPSSGCRGFG